MKNRTDGLFREWAIAEGLIDGDLLAEADGLAERAEQDDGGAGRSGGLTPLSEAQEREAQRRAARMRRRQRAADRVGRDSRGISLEVREKFAANGISDLLEPGR